MVKKGREFTETDMKAWQQSVQGVKPILPSKFMPRYRCKNVTSVRSIEVLSNEYTAFYNRQHHSELLPLSVGAVVGVDKSTVAKIKRDRYVLDAIIDLHGYNIDAAYEAVENFIVMAVQKKYRLLLIITGKSMSWCSRSAHALLPSWLNNSVMRQYVLYFNYANKRRGGKGAFYVLLRKFN